jgi:hypothetical protein
VDIVLDRPDLVDFIATALDDINGSRDFHFQVSRDSKFKFKVDKFVKDVFQKPSQK